MTAWQKIGNIKGADGASFLTGAAPPGPATPGKLGDVWLVTPSGALFQKGTATPTGGWAPTGTTLAGAAGSKWVSGPGLPAGGGDGDFYLRTDTNEVFGPKVAVTGWPAVSSTKLGDRWFMDSGAPSTLSGLSAAAQAASGDFYLDQTTMHLYRAN